MPLINIANGFYYNQNRKEIVQVTNENGIIHHRSFKGKKEEPFNPNKKHPIAHIYWSYFEMLKTTKLGDSLPEALINANRLKLEVTNHKNLIQALVS